MDQLKTKTVKGLYYLGMGKSLSKILSFVNTIILARLLTPEDYGLMALVMVVIGFIGFFNEVGLGSAIRQRIDITEQQLNGVFSLTLIISISLYLMLYLSSPLIAHYYEDSRLTTLLQVCALTFIIGGLATVPEALLSRDLKFRAIAGIEFISVIVHCLVTLILAWFGNGVWALLIGFIAAQTLKTALFGVRARWLPSKLGHMSHAKDLMRFGLSVTYSQLTWYFYNNANTLIVGKMMNSTAVGVFTMATSLATLPTSTITTLVTRIASPVFAKMQTDLVRLDNAMLKLTTGISFIAFPMMVGMTISAQEMVTIILGEKWSDVVMPLQALCLVGMFKSVEPLITQAFISIGKANITARYTTLCAVIIPMSVFIGITLGNSLFAVAIALGIAYPLSSIYLFILAKRNLNFSLKRYIASIAVPLEASIWMAVWIEIVKFSMDGFLNPSVSVIFVTEILTGMLSYGFYLIYIRVSGLEACYEVLIELGHSKAKLNRWPFTKIAGSASK